jgi:hypothetical protein
LLSESAEKLYKIVSSATGSSLDFSQVNLPGLRKLLVRNFRLSLTQVKTELRFSSTGYKALYQVPRYSEAFTIYDLRQVPYYDSVSGSWFKVLNLPGEVILSQDSRVINSKAAAASCQRKDNLLLCNQGTVAIRKPLPTDCGTNIVLALHSQKANLTQCKFTRIAYTLEQEYLLKNDSLVVANPSNPDTLRVFCRSKGEHSSSPLPVGLSLVKYSKDCEYSTSEFTILGSRSEQLGQAHVVSSELKLINSLMSAESDLQSEHESMLTDPALGYNLSSLLTSLDQELAVQGQAVAALKDDLDQAEITKQLSNLDPFTLDFSRPTSANNVLLILFWVVSGLVTVSVLAGCFFCPEAMGAFIFKGTLSTGQCCCGFLDSAIRATRDCCRRPEYEEADSEEGVEMEFRGPEPNKPVELAAAAKKPIARFPQGAGHFGLYFTDDHRPVKTATWLITEGLYGDLVLSGRLQETEGRMVHYSFRDRAVLDDLDRVVVGAVPPSQLQIAEFLAQVNARGTPKIAQRKNRIVLEDYPFIQLYGSVWVNEKDGSEVAGLKAPEEACWKDLGAISKKD